MDNSTCSEDKIAELVAEHGAVPPPWFMFQDTHPYSICWRMGAGEDYITIFFTWWKEQALMSHNELSIFGNGHRHRGGLHG